MSKAGKWYFSDWSLQADFFMHEVYREHYQDQSLWGRGDEDRGGLWTTVTKKAWDNFMESCGVGRAPTGCLKFRQKLKLNLHQPVIGCRLQTLGWLALLGCTPSPGGMSLENCGVLAPPSSRKIEHFSCEGSGGSGQQTTASTPCAARIFLVYLSSWSSSSKIPEALFAIEHFKRKDSRINYISFCLSRSHDHTDHQLIPLLFIGESPHSWLKGLVGESDTYPHIPCGIWVPGTRPFSDWVCCPCRITVKLSKGVSNNRCPVVSPGCHT